MEDTFIVSIRQMGFPGPRHEAVRTMAREQSPRAAGTWQAPGPLGFARELGAGFQELGGKLVAYYLVRLRAQPQAARGNRDLTSLVADVYRGDPRHIAFLLERLCYDFVKRYWRAGEEPRHLLDGKEARWLPEQSLILLHAGLGMALAEHLLAPLHPDDADGTFDAALDRFAELVKDNARPEFAAVPFEAMGVMVRRFLPGLHGAVSARLLARDTCLAAYYWHGAGRAIYFLPGFFLPSPGVVRGGLEACRREPPERCFRLDALAGFCFASTMINLRHPELVARLLPHLEPGEAEAVASGVAAALMTRHHTCPYELGVRAFLRPIAEPGAGTAGGGLAGAWEGLVRGPCEEALVRAYPLLRARGELATLARHRPLGTLLAAEPEE
jgi:hypothetical protein